MVGQLIRLKLRIMWNVMCKQVVVLLLSLMALLYGLAMVGILRVVDLPAPLGPTKP